MTLRSYRLAAAMLPLVALTGGLQVELPGDPGPTHMLVATTGDVGLKREGWTSYVTARFGVSLRRGDLLRLASDATARIVCADLTLHVVSNVTVTGVPCVDTAPVLVYKGSLLAPTRADATPGYPTVIAPRRTKLLDVRPIIRWAGPPGVTAAAVTMSGPGLSWTRNVTGTTVPYPDDAPPLVRGQTYRITITTGGRNSDEEGQPGTGFTPATQEELSPVIAARQSITRLTLAPEAAALLTARLYSSRGFVSDAIAQVEPLAQRSEQPVFLRELAGLYISAGLNRLAAATYNSAVELAHRQTDIETEAAARYGLGVLYTEVLGNPQRATSELQAALSLYEHLGDATTVRLLRERLRDK